MKWLTRLLIAAVFMIGLAGGTLFGIRLERERFLKLERKGTAGLLDGMMRRLGSELKTSDAQNEQFEAVFAKALPEIAAIENERRAKMLAVMENVKQSASSFLDDVQRQTYDVIHQRLKERFTPLTPDRMGIDWFSNT
jgi:hypothetical protein